MTRNLWDPSRLPGIEYREREERHDESQGRDTQDRNVPQERHRGDSMARKQAGQKFVSDEDIVKRRTA